MEDGLYELVQSLSAQELSLIHQYIKSRTKKSQIQDLLVALRDMRTYNAQRLRIKFKHLEIVRFRLRQTILLVLRSYGERSSASSLIHDFIQNFEILYEKGLIDECYREIKKAEDLASSFHCLDSQIKIADLLKRLALRLESRYFIETISDIHATQKQVLSLYNREVEIKNDYTTLLAYYRIDNGKGEWPIQQMISEEELYSSKTPFYTRSFGLIIASMRARHDKDLHLSARYMRTALDLWEMHPHIRDIDISNYKEVLSIYAICLAENRDLNWLGEIIEKINSFPCRNRKEEAERFQHLARIHLFLIAESGFLSSDSKMMHDIEIGSHDYMDFIDDSVRFSIWGNLMIFCFVQGDYHKASHWVEIIISHKKSPVGQRTQHLARLFDLLIKFETDVMDPLDSLIISTYRYFERKGVYTTFKREVLRLVLELIRTPMSDRLVVLGRFLKILQEHELESMTTEALEIRVIKAWAQSKLSGVPMSEILQKAS